jgi:Carboxypeptidase regulatory-like domain
MNRLGSWLLLTLCIVSLLAAPMMAQKSSGTIRGVVTDPSGAVLANIPVVITNTETGQERTVNTNTQGEYVAPEIAVGTYKVTVKAPNFKESVTSNVDLHTSSTQTLNIQLQVGSTSEQVTVAASEVQVQTDNAALGEVVTGEQVRELPLNGRSFVQLTQLQPGVSAADNFSANNKGLLAGVDFSVNGNATTNNLFLVDGANNNDVGSNRTILIYPSIEAISEFKMLRNSYGPEYGQASGAVINIVTRSGSNQWHGDVLYFGRNDALNAEEWFAHAAGVQAAAGGTPLHNNGKNELRRNDYGFSIGGPIKKDKLFIFYSQEWNKEIRGITRQSCVPSAAERGGDFSNPTCGEPLPTGLVAAGAALPSAPYTIIPSMLDPAGQTLEQWLPLPNLSTPLAGGADWSASLNTPIDWSQFNIRLDYNISHSQTLMFRYTQDSWTNNSPNGNSTLGLWGDAIYPALNSNWAQPSKQVVGRLTSTIGTSMVNDLEFAYSDNRINITPGGTDPGLLPAITAAIPPSYPEALKTSKLGTPTLWGGLGGYTSGNTLWLIAPWKNSLDIYTVRDDFSKVMGPHTLRFGAFLGWNGKNEYNGSTSSTEYPNFGTSWGSSIPTGNDLANILIKSQVWSNMGEQSTNTYVHLRWRDYEFYAADNWKVRRNLTVDVGLRYSVLAPPYQPNNQFTSFRPDLYNYSLPSSDACNGLITVPGYQPCQAANAIYGTNFTPAGYGQNKYLRDVNYHLFAPRLGISWDPTGNGNMAIRAGFGQFFQRDRTTPAYVNANNAPFSVSNTFTRTLDTPPTNILGGSASPSGGYDPSANVSNSLQWNLAFEYGFRKNLTLEVGYVGNHAIHQLNNYDINPVPTALWGQGAFSGSINNLRTYPGWGTLAWWLNNGSASYNSLQILGKWQVQKLNLQAAYTWGHSIGDITNTNSSGGTGWESYTLGSNPSLDRGNTAINRPQVFVLNAVYYLPDLKGQNGWVQSVAGGWELAAISQYASGASFSLYQAGLGEATAFLAPGSTGGGALNSLFGDGFTGPQRPLVSGQGCKANTGESLIVNPQSVSLLGYAIGTYPSGVEPRGYCHGPSTYNTDFSVDKNWRVWGERLRIQFRMDFFNLFNHANFRGDQINGVNGGTTFQNVNCGPANAAGFYQPCSVSNNIITRQTYNTNAGYATSTKGARELQYGLKIIF